MACINAYRTGTLNVEADVYAAKASITELAVANSADRLLFGVDSSTQANQLLQNNIEEFEWVIRNKIYPNFYGRYLVGENCLTKEEIGFIHSKGCKIAAIYVDGNEKQSGEQGALLAKAADIRALELGIPEGTAIFLEINENEPISDNFFRGFAESLIAAGYTPGFKANTDAKFTFDREFSRGMQNAGEVFRKSLIWAVAPAIEDYNRIRTSHLIHPDNWAPYAPSGLKRNEIAVWQYGRECHPIENDRGDVTTFNLNLVRNEQVIIDKMF